MNIIELVLVGGGVGIIITIVGEFIKMLIEDPRIVVSMLIILIPVFFIIHTGSCLLNKRLEGFEYNPDITLLTVKEWEKLGYEVRSFAGNRGAPIFFYTRKKGD